MLGTKQWILWILYVPVLFYRHALTFEIALTISYYCFHDAISGASYPELSCASKGVVATYVTSSKSFFNLQHRGFIIPGWRPVAAVDILSQGRSRKIVIVDQRPLARPVALLSFGREALCLAVCGIAKHLFIQPNPPYRPYTIVPRTSCSFAWFLPE